MSDDLAAKKAAWEAARDAVETCERRRRLWPNFLRGLTSDEHLRELWVVEAEAGRRYIAALESEIERLRGALRQEGTE